MSILNFSCTLDIFYLIENEQGYLHYPFGLASPGPDQRRGSPGREKRGCEWKWRPGGAGYQCEQFEATDDHADDTWLRFPLLLLPQEMFI